MKNLCCKNCLSYNSKTQTCCNSYSDFKYDKVDENFICDKWQKNIIHNN